MTYLGALDFGAGRDDLGLTSALALGSHAERVLQILGEDYVLDEHRLDFDAPAHGGLLDDLADGLRNLLAAFDDVLQHARTNHMAECSLRALNERLSDVGDAEGGLVG